MIIPTLAAIIASPDSYTSESIGAAIALHLSNATEPQPSQMYTGSFANPNGNLIPATTSLTALYIADLRGGSGSLWMWSVNGQNWFRPVAT